MGESPYQTKMVKNHPYTTSGDMSSIKQINFSLMIRVVIYSTRKGSSEDASDFKRHGRCLCLAPSLLTWKPKSMTSWVGRQNGQIPHGLPLTASALSNISEAKRTSAAHLRLWIQKSVGSRAAQCGEEKQAAAYLPGHRRQRSPSFLLRSFVKFCC